MARGFKESSNGLQAVYDKRGNFIGYIEEVKRGEYNHYDQDGNYICSNDSRRFPKNEREKESSK